MRAVCLKALAPDPRDRYAGADELAGALEALQRPARRGLWLSAAVACVALVALVPFARKQLVVTQFAYDDTVPTLTVEVRESRPGAAIMTLRKAPTPATGSEVKVTAHPPDGIAATLFHIGDQGQVRKLESRPSDSQEALVAPSRVGRSFNLAGNGPTTEVFLAVGRRNGPVIEADELRAALANTEVRLPALPAEQFLRITRREVEWEPDRKRDIKVGAPAPEWAARDQLEQVRQALRARFDYFEGVAFTHR